MDNDLQIKPATVDDVPLILLFIQELAAFEKLSHEVVATEAILQETLFGDKPHAEVVIGYLNDTPVSFALFFHNFSTFLGNFSNFLEKQFLKFWEIKFLNLAFWGGI